MKQLKKSIAIITVTVLTLLTIMPQAYADSVDHRNEWRQFRQTSQRSHYSQYTTLIQYVLSDSLDIIVDVDGDFGPLTTAAVKSFQRENALSVDGIVGPNTWGKLSDCSLTWDRPDGYGYTSSGHVEGGYDYARRNNTTGAWQTLNVAGSSYIPLP